jgi:penicillin amidase
MIRALDGWIPARPIQYARRVVADSDVRFGDGFDDQVVSTPRFRRTRLAAKLAVLIIGTLIVAGLLFVFWLTRRPFPDISGQVVIDGLDGEVEIIRDDAGVPHIYASSMHDLFMAQGYVHAQDRFWQMDTWRHIGTGRISEMFGEDQVATDSFLRVMGWQALADQQYTQASPPGRSALDAYTDGVNAYIAGRSPSELAFEYSVLELVNHNYTPEPWSATDSIVWGKVMAWDLRGNMDDEIARSLILDDFTPDELALLYPAYPEENPVIVGNTLPRVSGSSLAPFPVNALQTIGATALGNIARVDAVTGRPGVGVGSNSLVIGPQRTATGAAILANDPHLGIRMPSIWYQVALHCQPKTTACPLDVTGFSFAGMPGIIIGHNDQIAWGLTNLGPDVMDLYVERINPGNPNQYLYEGEWLDMDTSTETIAVAGGDPVTMTVRSTRHGPIISDNYEILEDFTQEAGIPLPGDYAISLRWTALEEGSAVVDAALRLNLAQDFEGFRDALRLFDVPAQNVVYADRDGNIGYQAPGKIPIRTTGDGRVPVPGWNAEYEWSGYIPFDDLPFSYNPEEGYIVTANNPVVDDSYPFVITTDWNYGDRAARIVAMIEADPSIDLSDVAAMQRDTHNPHADRLVPWMLDIDLTSEDEAYRDAQQVLAAWDRDNDADSAGAAVFETAWSNLLRLTFHDDMRQELWPAGGSRWSLAVSEMLPHPGLRFWDNRATAATETGDEILRAAFIAGVDELVDRLGDDPGSWEWGDLHQATFRNETLGKSGTGVIEARFNRGPYRVGGGPDIVDAIGYWANEGYEVTWLPSMRMIVDFSDLENSRAIHTTGQSGHAYSSHYRDMIEDWSAGQPWPMRWDRSTVEQHAEGTLRLIGG